MLSKSHNPHPSDRNFYLRTHANVGHHSPTLFCGWVKHLYGKKQIRQCPDIKLRKIE